MYQLKIQPIFTNSLKIEAYKTSKYIAKLFLLFLLLMEPFLVLEKSVANQIMIDITAN